jgi:hypothetical protein
MIEQTNKITMSDICFVNTSRQPLECEHLVRFLCELDWYDHVGIRLHFYYDHDTERDDQAVRMGDTHETASDPTLGWWDLQDHKVNHEHNTPVGKVTANVHTKIYGDRSTVVQILYPCVDGDNCYLYHVNGAGIRPLVFARAVCEGNANRQDREEEKEIDPSIAFEAEQKIQIAKLRIIADLSWIDSADPAQLCAYIREQALQQGERICAEYDGAYTGELEVKWADRLLAIRTGYTDQREK